MPEPLNNQLQRLLSYGGRLERPAFPYGAEDGGRPGVVLIAPFGIKDEAVRAPGETASSEDDETGSFIGQAQPLVEHCEEVVEQAGRFAVSAGLPEPIISDLRLAGWLHDAGKADPRFQFLLADGDPFAMEEAGAVLAKSARGRSLPGAWGRAKLASGGGPPPLDAPAST